MIPILRVQGHKLYPILGLGLENETMLGRALLSISDMGECPSTGDRDQDIKPVLSCRLIRYQRCQSHMSNRSTLCVNFIGSTNIDRFDHSLVHIISNFSRNKLYYDLKA